MRLEVSTLLPLHITHLTVNKKTHISDEVYIEKLNEAWLKELKIQCPKVAAIEQLERSEKYSHRFYREIVYAGNSILLDDHQENIFKSRQLLLQATVLSRIVKPTSIGYGGVCVISGYNDTGYVKHKSEPELNNFNIAFVNPNDEQFNTIEDSDVNRMAKLWKSFQLLIGVDNSPKYRRIRQSILWNEWSNAIHFADVQHPTTHSALEAIICTGSKMNKAQVVQRLPQLVKFINQQEAEQIYDLCCDLKHAANPIFSNSESFYSIKSSIDSARANAVKLLNRAVREIHLRAMENLSFADVLADPKRLADTYKVYDRKNNLIIG